MGEIYDKNRGYALLKHYVDMSFGLAYRRIEFVGSETIPTDGAVILSPNHTNALMDALAVLKIDRRRKVFVARADIFRQPLVARILRFLKIMPINRIRDGRENLSHNDKIIEQSADVLHHRVPFCILPEATHRPMHSLLPLKKGIFRIAFKALDADSSQKVYVVPVWIDYGNFFRFGSTCLVRIGEAIDVGAYVAEHPLMERAELMNRLKELLRERMIAIGAYVEADQNYSAVWDLARILAWQYARRCDSVARLRRNLLCRQERNRFFINCVTSRLATCDNATPEQQPADCAAESTSLVDQLPADESLAQTMRNWSAERICRAIGLRSVVSRHVLLSTLLHLSASILLLPLTVVCGVLMLPMWVPSLWLGSLFSDDSFRNTVRFVLILIYRPLLVLAALVVGIVHIDLVGWWLPAGVVAIFFVPEIFYSLVNLGTLALSDLKWLSDSKARATLRNIIARLGL